MLTFSSADKSIIEANLNDILEHGLGRKAASNFAWAKDACAALGKLAAVPRKFRDTENEEENQPTPFQRLPQDHAMFERVISLLVGGLGNFDDPNWVPMMEEGLNLIFSCAEHSPQLGAELAKKCAKVVLSLLGSTPSNHTYLVLARYFSMIGHLGLRVYEHLDVDVVRIFQIKILKSL